MTIRVVGTILSLMAITTLIGCGGQPTRATTQVRGTVTMDGKPLEKASIVFDPIDGQGGAASGGVVLGKFEFPSEPGSKRVSITAVKVTDEKGQYGEEVTVEMIPAQYNSETKLNADVKLNGTNEFQFDLVSK